MPIIGNNDGPGGRNDTYKIGNRSKVKRIDAVKEVESGKHKNYHVRKINGKKFVCDNPDNSPLDNVNRNK